MRSILSAGLLIISGAQAFASGGLSCTAEDKQAAISVEGGVTRGMGGPLFNFRGSAEIKAGAAADDLRNTVFEQAHVAQYWLDGKDLRLVLYREREGDRPHGYVEITVLAQASDDEGLYRGTYELNSFDTAGDTGGEGKKVELKGEVSCFVE